MLHEMRQTGTDGFNRPIYEEIKVPVENVLVAPVSSDDLVNVQDLSGKKAVYVLAIPKTDRHDWEDKKVSFFGKEWHTMGIPQQGIEENIPLDWNRKVTVERYE